MSNALSNHYGTHALRFVGGSLAFLAYSYAIQLFAWLSYESEQTTYTVHTANTDEIVTIIGFPEKPGFWDVSVSPSMAVLPLVVSSLLIGIGLLIASLRAAREDTNDAPTPAVEYDMGG